MCQNEILAKNNIQFAGSSKATEISWNRIWKKKRKKGITKIRINKMIATKN